MKNTSLLSPLRALAALAALALAMLVTPAQAGLTNIAQVPLLNMTGTGSVKPNLMLLFDNSGSMDFHYLPDSVGYGSTYQCRAKGALRETTANTLCSPGHPPFMAADFNRIYYNPAIRYKVPVKFDGSFYPDMGSSSWSAVPMDGFGSRAITLGGVQQGSASATTNLLTGFPDIEWCDSNAYTNCRKNTATYTYPDNTFTYAHAISTGPYYYNIGVAQYCSDVNLTTCTSISVGAAAPTGYPYPVKIRWCDTLNLNNCQAKQIGNFKYPSFSTPIGAVIGFSSLTVSPSSAGSTKSLTITSISVNDTTTTRVISNGTVTAPSGTDTPLKRQTLASKMAESIMAKGGLAQQFWACVRTPVGTTTVSACSTYGINLASDDVVALIPLDCTSTANKLATNCSPSTDNVATAWTVSAVTPKNGTDNIVLALSSFSTGTAPASTFERINIVSTNNSYPKALTRDDCAGSTCTYNEEMTNFANWYAYYKSRVQMTKTAVGLAFSSVTGNFRVGLSKMSAAGAGGAIDVKPADFTSTARQTWYSTFYATTTSGSTPTRPALDNVGKMFANIAPYNYTAGNEVVQYPCQQNFILLTTDGYWNQGYSGSVVSNDEVDDPSRFCTAGRACTDGRSQSAPSLADIALYWYNGGSNNDTVSLRPGIDDVTKAGLVSGGPDENSHLHVNTFTLGLGIDGVMNYEGKYDTAPKAGGDYHSVLTKVASGCPWNGGGAYVWPDPKVNDSTSNTIQERVDDLWHAAINGHGKYFSASDPVAVQAGLSEAIAGITVTVGAASAAATSTPNVSKEDNNIFSDTFITGKWSGELSDKQIDLNTGVVNTTALWNTSNTLGDRVAAATDTRTIKMIDGTTGLLKDFKYSAMTAVEKAWFDNKCSLLAQCALLSTGDKAIVNTGSNIVDWLRGQQQYADDHLLRTYYGTDPANGPVKVIVLGDIASSKPAFMRGPNKSYVTAGYSDFKSANASRAATVFTAANDGMLHAFDATTGAEIWAYVPRITMKKLYKQTSTNYNANHQFTTDGSPELGDVQIGGVWKTVLVAGLNGGGRGFYALDVTDPANPLALWELCADSTVCSKNDPDIGLSFGNPQFGLWQGKWVVFLTSGYNNVSGVDGVNLGTTGHGFLYIVDVATGSVLKKIDTGNGSVGTPSGLAKITSISTNPFTDPVTTYVYGGDNTGQMFRFDLTSAVSGVVSVIKMGDAGANQPITTRPEVTQCLETDTVAGAAVSHAQRVVIFGTGRLLDLPDISDTGNTQSLYMLKDSGSPIANIRSSAMVQQNLSLKSTIKDPSSSTVNLNTYTITKKAVDLAANDGWYVDLSLNKGERINLDPQIVDGGVNVVSTIPTASSSCTVGGTSNVYQFNVCTGSYVGADGVAGSTLSNTAAAVGFIIVRLPTGTVKMITTLANGTTITTNVTPPNSKDARKVGWRSVNGE